MSFDADAYALAAIGQGYKPELFIQLQPGGPIDVNDFILDEIGRGVRPQIVVFLSGTVGIPDVSGNNGTLTYSLVSTGQSTQPFTITYPGNFNFSVYGDFQGTFEILRDTGDGPIVCSDGYSPVVFNNTDLGSTVLYEPAAGTQYYINIVTLNSGTLFVRFGNAT